MGIIISSFKNVSLQNILLFAVLFVTFDCTLKLLAYCFISTSAPVPPTSVTVTEEGSDLVIVWVVPIIMNGATQSQLNIIIC